MEYPITCKDCGACCLEMSFPPGYSSVLKDIENGTTGLDRIWQDEDDIERVKSLPPWAFDELKDYLKEYNEGGNEEHECCWLNKNTMECDYFDHRPRICRDLQIASEPCMRWRQLYQIGGNN